MAGQVWAVSADGGFLANPDLSKKMRKASQPMMKFRQFVRPVDGFGKSKGDTVDFDKISNVQTSGGKLTESVKIPETKYQIVKDSLVVDEYGNSVPYTGKLEAMSEFDINNPTQRALRDDMAKVFDKAVRDEMANTRTLYIPSGLQSGTFDNDGTATNTAASNLTVFHIKDIVDAFKTGDYGTDGTNDFNSVPPFTGPDGDYIAILSVFAARGIKDDPEWEEWHKYSQPESLIKGEVGRLWGCRVIESNNTAVLSNTLASNVLGEGFVFGDDPVIEGIAVPEELRAKIPQDYGRDKGVAWYFLGGWKLTWRTSSSGPGNDVIQESHVIHITSA